MRKMLLEDERFKNLRLNLIRHKMREVMKKAEDNDEGHLKRTLDKIWLSPTPTNLGAEYGMLDGLKRSKAIPTELYRKVVEEETAKKFREYLNKTGLKLNDALNIVFSISEAVGMFDSLGVRLRKIFLTELWQLDDTDDSKKTLFSRYIKKIPEKFDRLIQKERDRVYFDIYKVIENEVQELIPSKKEKEKRDIKKEDLVHIEKLLEDSGLEKMIKERNPDLIKEINSIF
jgi:hypothetical protein